MNVIDSKGLEHDVVRKPFRDVAHHVLEIIWPRASGMDDCEDLDPPGRQSVRDDE